MDKIEAIGLDDLDTVTSNMLTSFVADPTARFSYPDAAHYLSTFQDFSRIFFEGAIKHDTAWKIAGGTGAIAWFPPGENIDIEAMIEYTEKTCHPENLADLMCAMQSFEKYHPQEPHWYLGMIGVDPFAQGKGLGFELICHNLKHIDKAGLPTYLESSNPRNVALYERLGFVVLDTLNLGGKPTMTPMIRPAQ